MERFTWEKTDFEADASASQGLSEARSCTWPVTSERRRILRMQIEQARPIVLNRTGSACFEESEHVMLQN